MLFLNASRPHNWLSLRTSFACKRKYTSGRDNFTSSISQRRSLPDYPVRTRFAPSPTGYLHLGSLRTALFNYLLAKATGGQFLLRIEDTDQKRTIADSEERLCRDLEWAGLIWDEGPRKGGAYGPYNQSQRTPIYREHAEKLLQSGNAYRCFCSPEKLRSLAKLRAESGLPTAYDRTCAHISEEESQERASAGEAHVIRLKVPESYPIFQDLVHGTIRSHGGKRNQLHSQTAYEDIVLLKSDGFPTYHLANVVDDHYMKISHVIRGSEWLPSTPKHLVMYKALDWTPPTFAHVGLLVDQGGQKLSKRNLGQDISVFRDQMDLLPETLTNYVALLGWSHNRRNDIMNLQELVDNFSLRFTTGNTVASLEKLWYLQRAHAERISMAAQNGETVRLLPILHHLKNALKESGFAAEGTSFWRHRPLDDYLTALFNADARNYTTARTFVERNKFFFEKPSEHDLRKAIGSFLEPLRLHKLPQSAQNSVPAQELVRAIEPLTVLIEQDWCLEKIQELVTDIIATKSTEALAKLKAQGDIRDMDMTSKNLKHSWSRLIHRYIRWAIFAGAEGPDGARSMVILGRTESLYRFQSAAAVLSSSDPEVVQD